MAYVLFDFLGYIVFIIIWYTKWMKKFMFPAKWAPNNLCGDNRAHKLPIDIKKYILWPGYGKITAQIQTCRKKIIWKDIGYICDFIVGISSLIPSY